MIDFHTHILPGIDDGAIEIDESIAMARVLADFGYKVVCCTPHCIKGYYELSPKQVREATLLLQADLDNADITLTLRPGMEYMLDECFLEYADDLLPLGDTKLILCEAPLQAHPECVKEGLDTIIEKGFIPLIAHPERTPYFYKDLLRCETRDAKREDAKSKSFFKRLFALRTSRFMPSKKESMKITKNVELPATVLCQANLGSFTGFYGEKVQRTAYELLKSGAYTALATDLHNAHSATGILMKDKFVGNPLLKRISEFDGNTTGLFQQQKAGGESGQGELF